MAVCLEELSRLHHSWDVYAVATVQEMNLQRFPAEVGSGREVAYGERRQAIGAQRQICQPQAACPKQRPPSSTEGQDDSVGGLRILQS